MTSVLSIDPGIINLGLCLMKTNPDISTDTFMKIENQEILFWEVINLLSDEFSNVHKVCESLKVNKKPCSVNSSFKYKDEQDNYKYVCKTHSKDKPNLILLDPKLSSKSRELHFLSKRILVILDRLYENDFFKNIDYILIENQRKSNEQIKFVSSVIFGYLTHLYRDLSTEILLIPAKYKLEVYTGDKIWNKLPDKKYTKNKYLSVQHCKEIISDNPQLLNHFEQYGKKDDSSDCFLTGLYFIKNGYKFSKFSKKTRRKFSRK